jgi:transcriptional regulator with XRE-family HTH domain
MPPQFPPGNGAAAAIALDIATVSADLTAPPTEIAVALRGWRKRRRLSQLELALEAGTTQRHLSFIESGRSAPGRTMVIRLAEALRIPLRERNALLLAAGYAPAYAAAGLDEEAIRPVLDAIQRILDGHRPYPAIVVDAARELVAANAPFWALVDGVADELLAAPINVPRLILHPRGLAPRIVNLDVWAWHVIDALRQEAAWNPDERLDALVAELEGFVPGRPTAPGRDYLGFAVPLRLRLDEAELELITTLSHFSTAVDVTVAELRTEAFLPADELTAAALADLAGRAPSRSRT